MKKINIFCVLILTLCLTLCACGADDCTVTGLHADEDNDYGCDRCGAGVGVLIDFYTVNDLHGKLDDTGSNIGVDELTTYLENTDLYDEHTVFLSSGDMWQGSSESNLTEGLIITDWMNELGFEAMTLGNHEYDWGEEAIRENLALAEFPFIAINVYKSSTDERVDYTVPSVIVERGGVSIGIIGALGDCYSSIASDKTENVYFKVGDELTELVKAESVRLRENGADLIVYSLHDGYGSSKSGDVYSYELSQYYDVSLSDGYVDLVFEAHTHQSYVQTDSFGVYHLQGGGDNKGISHAEVKINTANGRFTVTDAAFVSSNRYASLSDSPIVDNLMDKYAQQIALGDRYLGFNAYYRDSDYLADLMAKLYTDWGVSQYGEDFDIVLGGGYINPRSPYRLEGGHVKYSQIYTVFPFDNSLTLCSVKGSDLKQNFINTTNDSYHVSYTEYGESIKNSIDDNGIYYIIADSYTASYKKNRLSVIHTHNGELYGRDLLASYIENGGLE